MSRETFGRNRRQSLEVHPVVKRIGIGTVLWTVAAIWILFSHSYYGILLFGVVTFRRQLLLIHRDVRLGAVIALSVLVLCILGLGGLFLAHVAIVIEFDVVFLRQGTAGQSG